MRFPVFPAICFTSFFIVSNGLADDATALTKEEISDGIIQDTPHATDEQKKAIKQALELFYVSSNKTIIDVVINHPPHAKPTNGDLFRRTILEAMAKGFEQMSTGRLKDKLPDFFISEAQKTHSRIIGFCQKTKDIKNLGNSPEFQAFSLATEQQDAILRAYLKREIGQTLAEAINV